MRTERSDGGSSGIKATKTTVQQEKKRNSQPANTSFGGNARIQPITEPKESYGIAETRPYTELCIGILTSSGARPSKNGDRYYDYTTRLKRTKRQFTKTG